MCPGMGLEEARKNAGLDQQTIDYLKSGLTLSEVDEAAS